MEYPVAYLTSILLVCQWNKQTNGFICCMIDENNTQQSITPIFFVKHLLLLSTDNVSDFNELSKSAKYSSGNTSKFWNEQQYGQAKLAISDDGDGLGRNPPRTAPDSILGGLRVRTGGNQSKDLTEWSGYGFKAGGAGLGCWIGIEREEKGCFLGDLGCWDVGFFDKINRLEVVNIPRSTSQGQHPNIPITQ